VLANGKAQEAWRRGLNHAQAINATRAIMELDKAKTGSMMKLFVMRQEEECLGRKCIRGGEGRS